MTGSKTSSTPRALIHKKILGAAGEMPGASMAEVAEEVSGASTDLVERVLREYGDPAAVESDPEEQPASDGGSASTDGPDPADGSGVGDSESPDTGPHDEQSAADAAASEPAASDIGTSDPETAEPDATGADDVSTAVAGDGRTDVPEETVTEEPAVTSPGELTEKERAVLEVVAERPAATQKEVADVLGVSRATVSKRASGIEGFDWQHRAGFVERVFGEDTSLTRGAGERSTGASGTLTREAPRADDDRVSPVDAGADHGASAVATDEVLSRLDRVEERLERLDAGDPNGALADPELAHKVVHACMESERVSGDEELQVVAAVLNGDLGD